MSTLSSRSRKIALCGFFTGSVVTVFLALRQSPPGGVQRWQEGAWGEGLTAEELAPSDGGEWTVLHDLERGTYNTDHVVIGHYDVYCLNSKKSIDRLEVADRGPALRRTNRYDPEVVSTDDRLLSRARGEASELSGLIRERTGIRTWVTPVVVWWGPFEAGSAVVDGVLVVQGRQLVAALRQQPSRPVHDVSAIREVLQPVPARGAWRVRRRPGPNLASV